MSPRKLLLTLASLLSLAAACASNGSSSTGSQGVVADTLGLRFDVSCGSGVCVLVPQNSSITALSCGSGNGSDAFVLSPDTLLSIYALHVPSTGEVEMNAADPSHPVGCTSDADCLAPGISMGPLTNSYTCQAGLCLLKESCISGVCTPWDGVLLTYDVLTLCQADLPWPTACPYITSRPFADRIAAVAQVCGANTCATVPSGCRQLGGGTGIDGGI